jgi:hypothetical protein
MLKTTLLALALLASASVNTAAESLTRESLERVAEKFRFFQILEPTATKPLRFLYADIGNHIHVYAVKDGRTTPEWESVGLGSQITALFVEDFEKDGRQELVVATQRGRILGYDIETWELKFENLVEKFTSISCMTAADIDDDPQMEVIFIAENHLFAYDGVTRMREWKSSEEMNATILAIADVDDDPNLEIILNSGIVVDSRFRNIDWVKQKAGGFGMHMRLLDLDGDGYPEAIGDTPAYTLMVYDLYRRREIW